MTKRTNDGTLCRQTLTNPKLKTRKTGKKNRAEW
jgi:hypothetical protein